MFRGSRFESRTVAGGLWSDTSGGATTFGLVAMSVGRPTVEARCWVSGVIYSGLTQPPATRARTSPATHLLQRLKNQRFMVVPRRSAAAARVPAPRPGRVGTAGPPRVFRRDRGV